jgi:predicted DNA-binding transcriptional regulator YafY
MAISKYPLIRYKVLDKCFRTSYKKYFIDDLVDECNRVLEEVTGNGESVKLRQIREDIAFMRSPEGWSIELAELFEGKKRIYRYEDTSFSIMNLPLNAKVMDEFRSSVEVLSQFEGMPQFDWLQESLAKMNMEAHSERQAIISFDSNPYLKGIEYLSVLYEAIKNKKVLDIEYKDFFSEEAYHLIIHPYFLKQYNNRWFLLGMNQENKAKNWNLAIDRIESITETNTAYIENCEIDWQEYFDDVIGVTKLIDAAPEEIVLHFYGSSGKYVENKPIHGSQRAKWLSSELLEVKIKVLPNYELERLILGYGEQVKVLAPEHLTQKISLRCREMLSLYDGEV